MCIRDSPGTGVLQFHPETRVTGDVLIAVLSGYKGRAALLSADPPKVRLSSGSEDVDVYKRQPLNIYPIA